MKHKPSLTLIYLVMLIGMVTVMGLAWAVWQSSQCCQLTPIDIKTADWSLIEPTITIILGKTRLANSAIETQLHFASETVAFVEQNVSLTPSPSALPIPTLPPYDASMSPTAAVFAGHLAPSFVHQFTPTLPPYDASMSPTAIPRSTNTPTATVEFAGCGWQWARQDLPDVTVLAQEALRAVDFEEVGVHVEAYGENCLNPDMSVRYFAAMTTDFYVSLPVADLSDMEAISEKVVIIYSMFSRLPQEKLPARLGYLDFIFISGAQTRRLRAMFDDYKSAIDASKTGQQLLDALGGLR